MSSTLIKNARIVNQGNIFVSDLLIEGDIISKIDQDISFDADLTIDAQEKYLIPGVIDDQVHFREPGLTHKANIYTESRAAVAGGITSFMEMPNTSPATLTQDLLEEKFKIAEQDSLANFTFFMGVSNNNIDEVLRTNPIHVGALKIFMGSSTGNMLVDNLSTLERVFKDSPLLIAVHCEDENIIQDNIRQAKERFNQDVPMYYHPIIRNEEACYQSSSFAVDLAKQYNTRLHVFHISTEKECFLFDNTIPLEKKRITSEVCIHHLHFDDSMYQERGSFIKWNPAVKKKSDKNALLKHLLEDRIDVIATDHAPHSLEEKMNDYFNCPSGGPMVQHALPSMLEFVNEGKISIEKMVEKMCHSPSICFQIEKRGFIKEGYFADLVLLDMKNSWKVTKKNILYKCGWSPFEDETFRSRITHTFVNGHLAYLDGGFDDTKKGKRLRFDR